MTIQHPRDEKREIKSMEDAFFIELANRIKALHNGAIAYIKKEEFTQAAALYQEALTLTSELQYHEGIAITLFGMANLAAMVGDPMVALKNAMAAKEMFQKAGQSNRHCNEMIAKMTVAVKKKGIQYEKKGKFQEAIRHFETCIPFADEKSKHAMTHEVKLLEKIIHDQKTK